MKLPKMLPIDPLVPWMRECNDAEGTENFAARCGISAKRISDFVNGRVTRIPFDALDKLLACEGSRTIMDFYPEYDDESFADYENVKSTMVPVKGPRDRGCSVEGCEGAHFGRGMCEEHYNKERNVRRRKVAA